MDRRQVSRLLAETHLFVMPSIVAPSGDRDGTPTVIAEALLHEVPVVATRVCGIPEMVRPGETGWLVPPEDPQALAQAISQALADPAEAHRRAAQWRPVNAGGVRLPEKLSPLNGLLRKSGLRAGKA